MSNLSVIITPEANKQLRHLPKVEQLKILKKLSALETNPLAGKKLSSDLSEARSLRAWPYRILYYLDKPKTKIFIVTIAHRQGVYK